MLTIIPFYAAAIAVIFVILSARVVVYRRANKLSVGDYGDKILLQRIRAQGNCAEYAPFSLLLIAMIELSGGPAVLVYLLGTLLLIGRTAHAFGFSANPQIMPLRVLGMATTFSSIMLSAISLVVISLL